MTLLPVVGRELRVAVRRRSTFWIRVLAASGATLLGAWVLFVQGDWQGGASAGKELFDWLAGAALLFGVLAGPVFTADTVSRERREGTLGLLFLTDLKGYDVVLGKLAAASLTAVLSILAILPVLAIPLDAGRVDL